MLKTYIIVTVKKNKNIISYLFLSKTDADNMKTNIVTFTIIMYNKKRTYA